MPPLKVTHMGLAGVNVDKNPLELEDNELRQAKNAIHDTAGTGSGIRKRPGLQPFNTTANTTAVLGGTTVPLVDTFTGYSILFLGRGGPSS